MYPVRTNCDMYPTVGVTVPGFVTFPMAPYLFTYKLDIDVVDNYIIIRFSLMASNKYRDNSTNPL